MLLHDLALGVEVAAVDHHSLDLVAARRVESEQRFAYFVLHHQNFVLVLKLYARNEKFIIFPFNSYYNKSAALITQRVEIPL